jgi:exopolyphosphatase/guanosine-5'-triphosphate,3'-diphosphate pyrophosphatase
MALRELGLTRFYYSTAGLREGIVADLVHRRVGMEQARLDADERRIVRAMVSRYGMSSAHVRKVADLAHMLFDGLRHVHQLPLRMGKLLDAAAHLYNIGHFINEVRHHRHSMYIVANSDMPGFTPEERMVVANLCRYHRKSTPHLTHESFQLLEAEDRRAVMLLRWIKAKNSVWSAWRSPPRIRRSNCVFTETAILIMSSGRPSRSPTCSMAFMAKR